jgi:acyl-coenzyme A thioesterase PaaI-like protein
MSTSTEPGEAHARTAKARARDTDTDTDGIFVADGEHLVPTGHARGPWDPLALHGGAPAALMTAAFERLQPGAELRIARLRFQFLRPVPLAPLRLSVRIVRPGRRVQELVGELTAAAPPSRGDGSRPAGARGEPGAGEEQVVCRASALRVREIPAGVPATDDLTMALGAHDAGAALGTPEQCAPLRFALDDSREPSFATSAMEMRAPSEGGRDPRDLGPGQVWMRLRHPLLAGEQLTPLARLAATADFGNGISAALPFDRYLFINADLTVQLQRPPRGEWIGLDARTLLAPGGIGLAESVLHDVHGPVGRGFQTLVVEPR